jgi:hypothetical protein
MSTVQHLIARLLVDTTFRSQVQTDPETVLREYDLTTTERAALSQLHLDKWNSRRRTLWPPILISA